ncbi:MAG TPA: thioredoxin domain-containing protein [Rhizomicrobium sp.]|jgi:protein-disulfide isomerase
MTSQWKYAAAGGLGGAALALILVVLVSAFGLLPMNGKSIHDYLLANPQVMVEMMAKLQAQDAADQLHEKQVAIDKVGTKAFLNPRVAFVTGPANAKTTVVEVFDYNCPYCRASIPAVQKFYQAHKNDTRFAFIEYPFKGPESVTASRAAIAVAHTQPSKYMAFHFLLMNEKFVTSDDIVYADAKKVGLDVDKLKADMNDSSVDLQIAAAHTLAQAAKIDSTPTFILNGKVREGTIDEKTLKAMTSPS